MRNTVRAFIGVSNDTSMNKNSCSTLILYQNGKTTKENFFFQEKETRRVILKLLIEALKKIPKSSELAFYSNNDLITFEWEKEYKKDMCFSPNTHDISLWNEIVTICNEKKILLLVKGEDSILSSYAYYS